MTLKSKMTSAIPWWARILTKIALSKVPIPYNFWKSMGLFAHGHMEDPAYALSIFRQHFERSGLLERGGGFTALEMGPGDSLLSCLAARAYGADQYFLVDVGDFAERSVIPFQQLGERLRKENIFDMELNAVNSVDEILSKCNAAYLTDGLASYRQIPNASVDFVWSQAVLEHVRASEFVQLMREIRRILKPNGVATHQVDLRDHLGGALNNMRIGSAFWETEWMASSGFYTNRIRFGEMCRIFEESDFKVDVISTSKWKELPTPKRYLAREFSKISEEELLVSDFFVLLRPATQT